MLRGRKKVHLDLKFLAEPEAGDPVPPAHEVALVRHVVDVMGADNVVVTGLQDEAVAAVRAWSRERHPDLLVGLSLSRDVGVRGLVKLLTGRLDELLPGPAAAVQRRQPRRLQAHPGAAVGCALGAARTACRCWCGPWTTRAALRAWLRDERAWMVTTNYPRRAVGLRREIAAS